MRQRLAIIVTITLVVGLLIALNAVNYVQTAEPDETELMPNRSTYNSGATGTRALYDLLNEAGYRVTRWRESPQILLSQARARVKTFVVVGRPLVGFDDDEAKNLLLWVEQGGRLVLIDRRPDNRLLPRSDGWTTTVEMLGYPSPQIDPSNAREMTEGTASVHPVQPTPLTQNVEAVRPSRFASIVNLSYTKPETEIKATEHNYSTPPSTPFEDEPSPQPVRGAGETASAVVAAPAPVVHLAGSKGAVLVDFPHGAGRIVVLSDPYIVANGGISLEDNVQLALNVLGAGQGLIAFDEYHQGRAATHNALATYFAGTPILAICGQLLLVVLVILWTRGRRFGRPLPLPQVDRRSSLEFVASMAELQQRARALDLAIENIYTRTRRVLTRYAGVDYHSSRTEIAERVAQRSSLNREQLESLMRECEETINGAPINERRSIELVGQLRATEGALGLRMRSREVKQAAEKI
ncbi:MAG: hypothetical protein JWM21_326 [Acidobacteria bacterium]|nr:hypothetical protein [Acidobacteriota bacterium]